MEEEINARDFIEQQLTSNGIFHNVKANDFAMYCPFSAHEGNTLLLQVCFDGQKIHCWGCGESGNYNKLAERLGLKKLPNSAMNGYGALDQELRNVVVEKGIPALPKGITKFEEEYRGLSVEFLAKFDSRKWYDPDSCGYRILWPVTHNGKLQGYTAGRLHPEMEPKYVHGPKGVIQTRRCLFPIDYPLIRDVVVLTEGPFSALRLLHEGIPAVACLGAQNWHSAKITMLQQRKIPIKGVIIAFDPDKSGEEGADRVENAIKDIFDVVERFDCPVKPMKEVDALTGEKKYVYVTSRKTGKVITDENGEPIKKMQKLDPGDMPASYVEKLRQQVLSIKERISPRRKSA